MRNVGYLKLIGVLGLPMLAGGQVSALTLEQARENCRATVGRPIVQECMRASATKDLEACRAQASPRVRACVIAALQKAHGRANVPAAIPKELPFKDFGKSELPAGFVPPPRTIADIAAILDSEKPDPGRIAKRKADADATPSSRVSRADLGRFYYRRGQARAELGRVKEATADAEKAIEVAQGHVDAYLLGRFLQFAGLQYSAEGNPRKALAIFTRQQRETNVKGAKGWLFGANRQIAGIMIQMGDIAQAEALLRQSMALLVEARTSGLPGWRSSYALRGQSWEADVEFHRGLIFEARGQFREAENSYRLAEQRRRASIPGVQRSPDPPPLTQMLRAADMLVLHQARVKAKQGRRAEAESDARRALLSRLRDQGKYSPDTSVFIMGLAGVLVEQGRHAEAERLTRVAIEISRMIGVAEDSQSSAQHLTSLANILNLQNRFREAAAVYDELDRVTAKWDAVRRQAFELNGGRIHSLYAMGRIEDGIAAAQARLKHEIGRVGDRHIDSATARGTLAIGLMKAGRDADAEREFRAAIPILMAAARESADDDDTSVVALRSSRLRSVAEAYIGLLARKAAARDDAALEAFALADVIRGRSVQQALASSSARMAAGDKALADLIRKEQDLSKQVNAQLGVLNNVLTLPSSERDENGVRAIQASVGQLRADRDKARAEIIRRYPSYADLIDPKAPTAHEIKATLKPDEAFLSFYFGREASFVWAVPKNGAVSFAAIRATDGELDSKIRKLREALEPQAAMVSDIPPYDLQLAHEIYSLLLKPVEGGWKDAKHLIVVTNGALGLLPLSLLPTAAAEVKQGAEPMFDGYRAVPWLARTHAVTMVPSGAALRTLRQIPGGSTRRERLIGFGDPIFSKEQADATVQPEVDTIQVASLESRGVPLRRRAAPQLSGVDSAELALLPRLPDTAEELHSIARALHEDPSKVLQLGMMANEQTVKSANLARYRVVAFATHGLVPGELNGLMQPALALTAPEVAGVDGDGVLTMEEILALRLDADWVVLSACNTGTGAGAGAEAASGLGRAFFYAGARALLVTNWSVHSQSARDLTTDVFRRQTADPKLTRGEALRQAMMGLLDGPGFVDSDGKTLYSYGHPLFWAPYTIIGDGGI